MKRDVLNKWVAALRSGKYEQGRGNLCKDNKFCCLGVLLDIENVPYDLKDGLRLYGEYRDVNGVIPSRLADEYKMISGLGFSSDTENYRSLFFLNDTDKLSFNEIADHLEKHADKYMEIED